MEVGGAYAVQTALIQIPALVVISVILAVDTANAFILIFPQVSSTGFVVWKPTVILSSLLQLDGSICYHLRRYCVQLHRPRWKGKLLSRLGHHD